MRNFRDVLEIMTLAEALKRNTTDDKEIKKIRARLYNQVMRSSRGLALDARDLSYHIGDQKAKKAVNDIKDLPRNKRQEALKWYFSAQFDPTDNQTVHLFAKNN